MLVLTRQLGESIIINHDITIKVISIHHNQVRIGIEADKSIPIHRLEIHEKIKSTLAAQEQLTKKEQHNA